jgi:hypothetical protein
MRYSGREPPSLAPAAAVPFFVKLNSVAEAKLVMGTFSFTPEGVLHPEAKGKGNPWEKFNGQS